MRLDSAHLDHARKVADAILYEGYLLYPYHRSSQKNQLRFQFGVLMPPAYGAIDACEPSASQTECLLECPDDAEVRILLRFLQLQRRTVYGVSPDRTRPPSGNSTRPRPWRRCSARTRTSSSTSAPANRPRSSPTRWAGRLAAWSAAGARSTA